MNRLFVLAALLLLFSARPLLAEEERPPDRDAAERMEAWADRLNERVHQWVEQRLREQPPPPPKSLNRNLRIVFELVPKEKPDDTFAVVTATEGFHSHIAMHQQDGSFEFTTDGRLSDAEDGRLMLFCNIQLHIGGKNSEAVVELETSRLLTVGETAELGTVGERSLTVRIDELKPAPVRK